MPAKKVQQVRLLPAMILATLAKPRVTHLATPQTAFPQLKKSTEAAPSAHLLSLTSRKQEKLRRRRRLSARAAGSLQGLPLESLRRPLQCRRLHSNAQWRRQLLLTQHEEPPQLLRLSTRLHLWLQPSQSWRVAPVVTTSSIRLVRVC